MPHVYEHLAIAGARCPGRPRPCCAGPFSDEAHAYAAKQLHRRGVEIKLGVSAKEIAADHVTAGDGTTIKTHPDPQGGGLRAAPIGADQG
jgi:NADH dehydrogenase